MGLLLINQLQSHQGWLLNHVMFTKDAPQGTSELLVISALERLAKENCRFVLIGPVPLKQLGAIAGLSRLSTLLVRGFYQCAKKFFHLSGHEDFWLKFQPALRPAYLVFPDNNLTLKSIQALLQAFHAGKNNA